MGLRETQNERFENSEVIGKYWRKQDSEVLKCKAAFWVLVFYTSKRVHTKCLVLTWTLESGQFSHKIFCLMHF